LFGGYGLALVVFGAYDSYPKTYSSNVQVQRLQGTDNGDDDSGYQIIFSRYARKFRLNFSRDFFKFKNSACWQKSLFVCK